MTSPRAAARSSLAALALVGAVALAGCGDDDEPNGAATPAGSSSAPASADATDEPTDASESAEPSDDSSTSEDPSASAGAPTAAPATGPVMQLDDMSLNAPQGWEVSIDEPNNQGAFNNSGGPGAMVVSLLAAVPGESFDTTLAGRLRSMKSDGLKPQRLDDITLDGVPTWVVSGSEKGGVALEYSVGGLAGGDTFGITFQFLTEPPPDVQTTIDGVLATVVFDAA